MTFGLISGPREVPDRQDTAQKKAAFALSYGTGVEVSILIEHLQQIRRIEITHHIAEDGGLTWLLSARLRSEAKVRPKNFRSSCETQRIGHYSLRVANRVSNTDHISRLGVSCGLEWFLALV